MIHTPLEQFEIIPLIPLHFGTMSLSFTNSSFYMVLVLSLAFGFFIYPLKNAKVAPFGWQAMTELYYNFIFNMVKGSLGHKGMSYFPLFFSIFSFLLFCNVLGMVPYSFTVTSHFVITFGLALAILIGITWIGFQTHGLHFFALFMPAGVPVAMAPLLVGIELISYLSRPFSLGIRLFANMMSGHTLFKILAGFAWTLLPMKGVFTLLGTILFAVISILVVLEFAIAVLQAYIFTVLVIEYMKDALYLH